MRTPRWTGPDRAQGHQVAYIQRRYERSSHIGVSVSIVPHESRSESEQLSLGGFYEKLDDFDGLLTLIENAKAALAISTHGRAFSKDLVGCKTRIKE